MPVSPEVPATWAVAAVIGSSEAAANENMLLRDRMVWSRVTCVLLALSGCPDGCAREPDCMPDQRHPARTCREAMRVGRGRRALLRVVEEVFLRGARRHR